MDSPSNWTVLVGDSPTYNSSIDSLVVGNSIIYQNLDTKLTEDFSLTVTANASTGSRNIEVMLLDDSGMNGYGFYVDYSSSGVASAKIVSFDYLVQPSSWSGWAFTGHLSPLTAIGSNLPDYVTYTLTWSRDTGLLGLYIGQSNVPIVTATNFNYSQFDAVYIRGNTNSQFTGSLTIGTTIPEPNAVALVTAVALLLPVVNVARRRLRA